jgi:hypothetical protein
MHACRARVSRAIIRSPAGSLRYGSGSLPTAFNSNRITTTWMKAIVGRSYFARRWSACGMQLLAAISSASMSTLRTDSPAVTSIKCC